MTTSQQIKRYQSYFLKRLALLGVILLVLNLAPPATRVLAADSDSQFFPETGKSVSGKFLQYWRANGGLPVFGFPITDPTEEVDPETGKVFLTQWFERNRFELHPENAGTKYEVLLGLLGKDLRREALEVDYTFVPTTASNAKDSRFFKETGHNVSDLFLSYWQAKGGLERFGFPISEARDEVDPETGKVFLTQWFERARFELHPENKGTDSEVLLGLLGKQLKTNPPATEFRWELLRSGFFDTLAVDNQANIWVAFEALTDDHPPFTTKLVKLDKQGRELFEFRPALPQDANTSSVITALATDKQGNIYIGEYTDKKTQVEKFDPQGHSLLTFGKKGNEPGAFQNSVTSLAVDQAGNLYVVSQGSAVINKYNSAGKFLSQIESKDNDPFPLVSPSELVIDGQGNLLIVDKNKSEVQKRDSNGNFVELVGSNCIINATYNGDVIVHLAINPQGRLYISQHKVDFEDYELCIERIGPDNKAQVVFKNGGLARGQLHQPQGIGVNNEDDLFVLNYRGQSANGWLDKFHFR